MITTVAERVCMGRLATRDRNAEPQGSSAYMQAVAVRALLEDIQGLIEQRDEREAALTLAHESLRWLGRAKVLVALEDPRGWDLVVIAIACAEQHATGVDAVVGVDELRVLLGWDGPDGPDAIARALAQLERLELWRGGRLVL